MKKTKEKMVRITLDLTRADYRLLEDRQKIYRLTKAAFLRRLIKHGAL